MVTGREVSVVVFFKPKILKELKLLLWGNTLTNWNKLNAKLRKELLIPQKILLGNFRLSK